MAYSPFQDGTQAFAIPDSPVTVNAIAYIAEDISINNDATKTVIKDANGIPSGRVIAQGEILGTAKLQLASTSTAVPAIGGSFTLQGVVWDIYTVGQKYTQGAYAYVDISFARHIN